MFCASRCGKLLGHNCHAGSHHKPNILAALDKAFNGKWYFCAKYSPFLKPIEKLFYLVKSYIQAHEVEALAYPITWINKALESYAVARPQGHLLLGHLNIYAIYARLNEAFDKGRI